MKLYLTLIIFIFGLNLNAQWIELGNAAFSPRHHPVSFSIDGLGYVTMGVAPDNSLLKDFYSYDPETNMWTELESYPGEGRGFSYADTWDGKAYIGFGFKPSGYANDLWEFNPQTMEWTELEPCPCSGRAHPAYVIVNGSLYVGAGNDNIVGNMNDFWRYDIEENSWSQIDNLPALVRHHPFYFGIGDHVYAGLGHGNMNSDGSMGIYRDFYRYDTKEEKWERVADLPAEGRVAGTQFSFGGKGYVLSGQNEMHVNFSEGEFWEYDPAEDSWTQLESHPGTSSRWAPGNFVINKNLYFFAGLVGFGNNQMLANDVFSFNLDDVNSVRIVEKYTPEIIDNSLGFQLENSANIQINSIDLLGNSSELFNGFLPSGKNLISLNESQIANGFNLIQIINNDNSEQVSVKYLNIK